MAHIQANRRCAFTLLTRRQRNPDGTSRPVNGRVRKEWRGDSEAFVENLDTILEEEQQRMGALDLDVRGNDVFEFNEDDADSPACKRVRLELLEDRLSDDDESVLSQESHPLGSTERMLGSTECNGDSAESANRASASENRVVEVVITPEGRNLRFVGGNEEETKEDLEEEEASIKQFQAYCKRARKDHLRLSREMKASVALMVLMNEKGGSIVLYDAISKWHRNHIKSPETMESKKLHDTLVDRYNLEPTLPFETKIQSLPHAKESADIACHDATAMIVDLLTDPRVGDADYLFNGNDPMAGIPELFEEVGDVNTGLAYRETYKELIEPAPFTPSGRRNMLLPIVMYMDGTYAGQFGSCQMEFLKVTLGIFNRKYRGKSSAWRNIGYVKAIKRALIRLRRTSRIPHTLMLRHSLLIQSTGKSLRGKLRDQELMLIRNDTVLVRKRRAFLWISLRTYMPSCL